MSATSPPRAPEPSMVTRGVYLFLPGLLELPDGWRGDVSLDALAPTLASRLRRGRSLDRDRAWCPDWRTRLAGLFGGPRDAVAPLEMRGLGLDPGEESWIRVDPVCMRAGLDTAMMIPAGALDSRMGLTLQEAQELAGAMGDLLGDPSAVAVPRPDRWYLRLDDALDVDVPDSAAAAGRDLRAVMPEGPDAPRLERMLTEIQMLFHDHPVNQRRRSGAGAPVNGVWIWGGGRLTDALPVRDAPRLIWTDEPLAAGLAGGRSSGGSAPDEGVDGPGVIVWTAPAGHALAGDREAWEAALAAVDGLLARIGPRIILDLGHVASEHRARDRFRPVWSRKEMPWIRWRGVG